MNSNALVKLHRTDDFERLTFSAKKSRTLRRWLTGVLAAVVLATTGCASTGGGKTGHQSTESDPLYDGISAITFDSVLIGDAEADFETLGDRALRLGETDKAIYAYLRASQRGGDKAVLFSKVGALHQSRGNQQLALLAFSRALEANPDYVPALQGAGLVHMKWQEHDTARNYLQRAVELDQKRLGAEQEAAESPDGSSPATPRSPSLSLPPFDKTSPQRAYNGLGILADLEGEHRQALRYFRVAGLIQPRSAITQNNVGYSFYLSGDLMKAEHYFLNAVSLNPGFKRGWCNLALVYGRLGRQHDALNALKQVMSEPEAYNTLGYINMLAGNHHEADQLLHQAIARSPSYYEQAHQNLAQNRERSLQ